MLKGAMVLVFCLAALVSGFFGLLAMLDPEGRGGKVGTELFALAVCCSLAALFVFEKL